MTKTVLPLLMIAFCTCSQAQSLAEVKWVDSNLKACVMKQAKQRDWTDTGQVTDIKCQGKNIESINELRVFSLLVNLSLYNNKLRSADLSELKSLQTLNIANNKLVSLNIRGLSQLHTLHLFRNKLKNLDLFGLSSLKKVRLMQNQLEVLDITPLVSLESGYFFDNQLEDLAITGLNKLKFLDVKQNPMPDELYDFYDEQNGIVISHDGNADDWK